MSNNRKPQRRLPRSGPTPVGQRLRAATINGRRFDGPTADEWNEDDDDA